MRRGSRTLTGWCLGLLAAALAFGAGSASAATLTVTTTNDSVLAGDGDCSLREAIIAVDSPGSTGDCGTTDATQNTIVLGPHTYTLSRAPSGSDDATSGDLDLTSAVGGLTVAGAGATISSSGLDRLLDVAFGASATLSDLTLTGGHAPNGAPGTSGNSGAPTAGGPGGDGGAILNGGTLSLSGVTVTGNSAGSGGVGGAGGSVAGNGRVGGAGGSGGGIATSGSGSLSLTNVTVTGNRSGDGGAGGFGYGTTGGAAGPGGSGGNGGGVDSAGGTLSVDHSTVAQNIDGDGGAGGVGGAGNSTGGAGGAGGPGGSGGGIAGMTDVITAVSDTIAGNLAGNGGNGGIGGIPGPPPDGPGGAAGDAGVGGGVLVSNAAATPSSTLSFVTLANNQLAGPGTPGTGGAGGTTPGPAGQAAAGGGLDTIGGTAVVLQTSVLASNALANCSGTPPVDALRNVTFGAGGSGGCPTTFAQGDPRLGPLRDNGGPTQTMALGAGSAAIGYGISGPHTSQCFGKDQRGIARSNSGCDVGAYQVTPPTTSAPAISAVTTTSAVLSATVSANQTSATASFTVDSVSANGASAGSQTVPGFQQPTTITTVLSGLTPATTYRARVIASSSDGYSQSTDTTFTTAAVPGAPGRTTAPPFKKRPVPTLSRVTLRPLAFLAAPLRGHRTGTTITYTDSLAALTSLTVLRSAPRISRGGGCVARTRTRHGRARRCTRLEKIGSFTHRDRAGENRVRFSGRLRHRALGPGRYRLEIRARMGTLTGKVRTLAFRILAPPRRRP